MASRVTIIASNIQDALGNKVTGTLEILPTDLNDTPLTVGSGEAGGGQIVDLAPGVTPITNGALQTGTSAPTVADSGSTAPANLAYRLTVKNGAGQTLAIYPIVQIFAPGPFNFDTYQPNVAAQAIVQTGPAGASAYQLAVAAGFQGTQAQWLASLQGPAVSFRGAYASGTTYANGDAVLFTDGSSYISLQNGNTGNAPNTATAWWSLLAQAGASSGGQTAITAALANSPAQTIGSTTLSSPTTSAARNWVYATPFANAGALSSVSVLMNAATAGSTLTIMLYTGTLPNLTCVDKINVTIAAAISSPTVLTFNAGTDFTARNVAAGTYIGFYTPPSQNPGVAWQTGASVSPGYLTNLSDSGSTMFNVGDTHSFVAQTNAQLGISASMPANIGSISAAITASATATSAAAAASASALLPAALANSPAQTIGSTAITSSGAAGARNWVLPTPFAQSAALGSVSVLMASASAGSTLTFSLLTGTLPSLTVSDQFSVTIAAAVSSPTVLTFVAGTHFAARNVAAGSYIGFFTPSSQNPGVAWQLGTSAVGYLSVSGDSGASVYPVGTSNNYAADTNASLGIAATTLANVGAIAAAITTSSTATMSAATTAATSQLTAALANSPAQTIGSTAITSSGAAAARNWVYATPLANAGALGSVSVLMASASAGSTLTFSLLTGTLPSLTVSDQFSVTIANAVSSPTVLTFVAGRDFAPRNVAAGTYIGFFTPSSQNPAVAWQIGGTFSPGYLTVSGDSGGSLFAVGSTGSYGLQTNAQFGISVTVPQNIGAISAAINAQGASVTSALTSQIATQISAASSSGPVTIGVSGGAVNGQWPAGQAYALPTPVPLSGPLNSITMTIAQATAGSALQILIFNGPPSALNVVDSFYVTFPAAFTTPTLMTFVAGTHFAARNVTQGEYLGFYVVSSGTAPSMYPASNASPGYLVYNGSNYASAAQSYTLGTNALLDFSASIGLAQGSTSKALAALPALPPPGNGTLLWAENYSNAFPATWLQSAGTWTANSGLTSPTDVTGYNSIAYLKRYYALDQRTQRILFTPLASGTIIGFGTVGGFYEYGAAAWSSLIVVDGTANTISICKAGFAAITNASGVASGSNPGVQVSQSLGWSIAAGQPYMLTVKVSGRVITATISEVGTFAANSATVTYGNNSNDTGTGVCGGLHGYPALVGISGQYRVSSLQVVANVNRPVNFFLGDSVTYGFMITIGARWANLIGSASGQPFAVSGKPGATSESTLERITTEVLPLRPRCLCLMIGENDDSFMAFEQYRRNILALKALLDANGIQLVVFLMLALQDDSNMVAMKNFLRGLGVPVVRSDLATSTGDGVTQNGSLFVDWTGSRGGHPNAAGCTAIFNRVPVDAPGLLE